MASLYKSDIAASMAKKIGGSKAESERALNAALEAITDSVAGGDRVVLTGFGSFSVKSVKPRKVRSIGGQDGEFIDVPAHRRVAFRAGTGLNKAARS